MQRQGIIVALEGNQAVVMTADGEFCRVTAPPSAEVGAELRWMVADRAALSRVRPGTSWVSQGIRIACAGLVAGLAVAVGVWRVTVNSSNHQPYAFVALDIEPGVKLTVNWHDTVLDARALNPEGRSLLADAQVRNTSLDTAVTKLVRVAADHHMIPTHDNILIATTGASLMGTVQVEALQNSVESAVKVALTTDVNAKAARAQVYTYQVSNQVWNAAEKLKVSPAKVAAYLNEMNLGHPVKLNRLHAAHLVRNGSSMQPVESSVKFDKQSSQTVESLIQSAIQQMNQSATQADGVTPTATPSGTMGTAHNQTGSDLMAGSQVSAELA